MLVGCRLAAVVLLLCLELCRKKSSCSTTSCLCVLSSTEEHKSNPEAAGRGLLRERWGRLRAVCGLCLLV